MFQKKDKMSVRISEGKHGDWWPRIKHVSKTLFILNATTAIFRSINLHFSVADWNTHTEISVTKSSFLEGVDRKTVQLLCNRIPIKILIISTRWILQGAAVKNISMVDTKLNTECWITLLSNNNFLDKWVKEYICS